MFQTTVDNNKNNKPGTRRSFCRINALQRRTSRQIGKLPIKKIWTANQRGRWWRHNFVIDLVVELPRLLQVLFGWIFPFGGKRFDARYYFGGKIFGGNFVRSVRLNWAAVIGWEIWGGNCQVPHYVKVAIVSWRHQVWLTDDVAICCFYFLFDYFYQVVRYFLN